MMHTVYTFEEAKILFDKGVSAVWFTTDDSPEGFTAFESIKKWVYESGLIMIQVRGNNTRYIGLSIPPSAGDYLITDYPEN